MHDFQVRFQVPAANSEALFVPPVKPKPLGDELRRVRAGMGLAIPVLAEKLGVDKNTLGSYEREERALPSPEFLAKFSKVTGADLAQLLELRLTASAHGIALVEALHKRQAPPASVAREPEAGYVYVPLYDVQAAAGARGVAVQGEQVVNELAFREDWIRSTLHVRPSDLSLLHVEGDSMEPDLRAGDIILIDHTDTTARREGIYVLRMDDALLVKQVQRKPGGVLRLVSRNAAYEPVLLPIPELEPGGKVSIIGRVVWACRRL